MPHREHGFPELVTQQMLYHDPQLPWVANQRGAPTVRNRQQNGSHAATLVPCVMRTCQVRTAMRRSRGHCAPYMRHPGRSHAAGLAELRALWPQDLVDEAALLQSDPRELALAVRALSTKLR